MAWCVGTWTSICSFFAGSSAIIPTTDITKISIQILLVAVKRFMNWNSELYRPLNWLVLINLLSTVAHWLYQHKREIFVVLITRKEIVLRPTHDVDTFNSCIILRSYCSSCIYFFPLSLSNSWGEATKPRLQQFEFRSSVVTWLVLPGHPYMVFIIKISLGVRYRLWPIRFWYFGSLVLIVIR